MKIKFTQARTIITTFISKNPRIVLMLNVALLLPLWFFVITPLFENAVQNKENVSTLTSEVNDLEKLKNKIVKLNKENKTNTPNKKVSLLKQVEEIAQTNGVFGRIKRLNPIQKTIAGKKRKGLTLIMEETSLNEITPFLYAIAHKSVLDITEISLRREGSDNTKEGMINVQVTLIGGV